MAALEISQEVGRPRGASAKTWDRKRGDMNAPKRILFIPVIAAAVVLVAVVTALASAAGPSIDSTTTTVSVSTTEKPPFNVQGHQHS